MAAGAPARAGEPPLAFSYAGGIAPMLWVLASLGLLELGVGHLLIALLWSPVAALVLSLVSLASVVWLVLLIRSLERLPVLVDGSTIVMRTGFLRGIEFRREDVAAVRTAFSSEELKQGGVLNLALLAYPNAVVELGRPVARGRRRIRLVAHRLDDPAAFAAAVDAAG
jgi:hypothetical protein